MSIHLMSRAWSMPIPTDPKMLLLALADRANDDGECWPGQDELARKGSMSPRSVVNHLNWLEDHGLIVKERRQKGNSRQSNRYTVTLDGYAPDGGLRNLECANRAHANPAHANPAHADGAHAQVAPPNVRGEVSASAGPAHSFNEEPPKNHQKEPSLHTPRAKALGAADLVRLGVDEQVAKDFVVTRKAKRLPLTQPALDGIAAPADRARLPLDDVIRMCVVRGWGGFRADWLLSDTQPAGQKQAAVNNIPKTYSPSGRL